MQSRCLGHVAIVAQRRSPTIECDEHFRLIPLSGKLERLTMELDAWENGDDEFEPVA